jgi:AcrR family transcriptional regulator
MTGVKAKVDRVAVELFAAKGVDGVSIAEIAGAAGVSQGALYRHYRSKDELASAKLSAAYLRCELDAIRASRSAPPELPPWSHIFAPFTIRTRPCSASC